MDLIRAAKDNAYMITHLYTVICDFNGGTYISQVRASDERAGLHEWASYLDVEQPLGSQSLQLAKWARDGSDSLVLLDGMVSVWCSTAIVEKKLVLVNVVRTV